MSAEPSPGDREELARLLAERSFRTGRFVLSSGRESSYYVDCRSTTMHARGQVLIGRVGLDRIEALDRTPEFVGGLTMGADPISYAIAGESARRDMAHIHAFSVRKEAKDHGRGRRIAGCFEAGAPVVVTEDVITTGGSALDACRAVEEEGGEILAVLVLVDREEGGGEALRDAGYAVEPLYTVSDLEALTG